MKRTFQVKQDANKIMFFLNLSIFYYINTENIRARCINTRVNYFIFLVNAQYFVFLFLIASRSNSFEMQGDSKLLTHLKE